MPISFLLRRMTAPVRSASSPARTYRSVRNALIQETVRAWPNGWCRNVVTALPEISDGYLSPLTGPGLGLALRPEFIAHPATRRRRSAA
jgi:L-alanine-DL-glutamate epimerase-like enolase superfamily enzyme